mgnify:CR=1 FL=1
MPTYNFSFVDTGKEFSKFMGMSELDVYLETNPNIKQIPTAPAIISGRGTKKPDDGFRDLLKDMKTHHSRGVTKSTINVF